MRHQSGELAPSRGVYHSNCRCRSEWRVRRGDTFPSCPTCQRPVTWLFTRAFLPDDLVPPVSGWRS